MNEKKKEIKTKSMFSAKRIPMKKKNRVYFFAKRERPTGIFG